MSKPEAFSRVLIDQALKDSDWDLLDERRVRLEVAGSAVVGLLAGGGIGGAIPSHPTIYRVEHP